MGGPSGDDHGGWGWHSTDDADWVVGLDNQDVPDTDQPIGTTKPRMRAKGGEVASPATAPPSIVDDHGDQSSVVVGTPVLALWRTEYYPAIVVDVHPTRAGWYRIRYCDDVLRWIKRTKFVTTWDRDFCHVPLADVDLVQSSFELSQEAQKFRLPPEAMPMVEEQREVLRGLLEGERDSRRRRAFFTDQRVRSALHQEIRTGPLTFAAYFSLLSSVQGQAIALLEEGSGSLGAFQREGQLAGEAPDTLQLRLLLRQFTAVVVMPELILDIIGRIEPNCVDREAALVEMSHAGQKDYVEYLLGQRDLAEWGRRRATLQQ